MLERLKWPGLALLLGGGAALARRWQLATAFEETLGLHRSGAVASRAMTAVYVLAAVIFLLLALREPVCSHEKGRLSHWDYTFAAQDDIVFLVAAALAGLLTLAAAPFLFREASELMALRKAMADVGNETGENGLLQVILAVCAVPTAGSLVFVGATAYRVRGRGRENLALLLPVLLSCIWLLEGYRANAADPVLWHYTPLLMAIGAGLLFQLDSAGLAFELGHPRRMLWLAAMTVVMSGAALASQPGTAMAALLAAQTLAALAALWAAPGNLRHPPLAEQFRLNHEPSPDEPGKTIEADPEDTHGTQEIQEEDRHV